MIHDLKKGTLVVQIPCEKRKVQILEQMVENETDRDKKKELEEKLQNYKVFLRYIQVSIVEAATRNYKFSKMVFLPDSSVKSFKAGLRQHVVLDSNLDKISEVEFEEDEKIMFIRGGRYYDYMYVHRWDGTYPPDPFPYYSSIMPVLAPASGYAPLSNAQLVDWKRLLFEAFANINFKMENFYEKHN